MPDSIETEETIKKRQETLTEETIKKRQETLNGYNMQAKRGAVFILAAVFIATILLLNYELIWSSKNNVYQSNANDTLLSPPSELLKLPNDLIHAFKDEPTMAFKDTEIIQDEPLVVINQETIPKANQTVIPKKIWSFWNDQPIPKFYTDCMERWKYFNPEYEIVMLTEASLASYSLKVPAIFYSIGPEWKADWIRLAILEMHGGIWIDASFIVAINMDWINDLVVHQNKDVFMFYSVPFTRYIMTCISHEIVSLNTLFMKIG